MFLLGPLLNLTMLPFNAVENTNLPVRIGELVRLVKIEKVIFASLNLITSHFLRDIQTTSSHHWKITIGNSLQVSSGNLLRIYVERLNS